MESFWNGFEKKADGVITQSLKRLGMNTTEVRKSLAKQIRENRKSLLNDWGMNNSKGFKEKVMGYTLNADAGHAGKSMTVEHAAAGIPHNIIERSEKTNIVFPRKDKF